MGNNLIHCLSVCWLLLLKVRAKEQIGRGDDDDEEKEERERRKEKKRLEAQTFRSLFI